jgi:hypothetical protein
VSTIDRNLFLDHRARALANVFLMGRISIMPLEISDFGDVDLLARILPDEDSYEKLFGVIIKTTTSPLSSEQAAIAYLNQWARAKKKAYFFPFPILVLVFSMLTDDGYFAWRLEPDLTDGRPTLKVNTIFDVQRATKKGLDALTKSVDEWYSQQYHILISK